MWLFLPRFVVMRRESAEFEARFRHLPVALAKNLSLILILTLTTRIALWRMTSAIMTMMLSITLMSLVRRHIYLTPFQIGNTPIADPQVATVATLTNTANAILL